MTKLIGLVFLVLLPMARAHESGVPMETSEVERTLENVMIEEFAVKDAPLSRAIGHLREILGEKEIELRIGYERVHSSEVSKIVSIDIQQASVGKVLEAIGGATAREVYVHHDGVVLARSMADPDVGERGRQLIIRSYRVPPSWLDSGLSRGDPFEPPRVDEIDPQRAAKRLLEMQGIQFPEGATLQYRQSLGVVTAKNTRENHELLEAFLSPRWLGFHQTVRISAEVYTVPRRLVPELAAAARLGPGGRDVLHQIRHAMDDGMAKLTATPSVVTRSGQRAKVSSGKELRLLSGWSAGAGDEGLALDFEKVEAGTTMECDPVISYDNEAVEVNIALAVALGEPVLRKVQMRGEDGVQLEVEAPTLERATLITSTTVMSGQAHYLGVLDGGEGDEALVAMLTVTIGTAHRELAVPE